MPLDIIPRTTGRAPVPVTVEFVREVTREDLAKLSREKGSRPSPLVRIRERHHALARALASGRTNDEAAAICGYDPARVSILAHDPTFKNLVLFYREDKDRQFAQVHEQLAGMALDAALILRERMEDREGTDGELSNSQLASLVSLGADRTGNGPASKSEVNVNINLADRLQEARKRIQARVLELEANRE